MSDEYQSYEDSLPGMVNIKAVIADDVIIAVKQAYQNVFLNISYQGITQITPLTENDAKQLIDALITGIQNIDDFKAKKK